MHDGIPAVGLPPAWAESEISMEIGLIGGLVSYPLTAVAALVVGIVEAFSSFYASNYKEVIVFMLLIPVLLLRSLAAPAVEEEKD